MGPHGICMRFVFRNMLTLSLSLSIGVAEATPRRWSNGVLGCLSFVVFSPGEISTFRSRTLSRYVLHSLAHYSPLRVTKYSRVSQDIAKNYGTKWHQTLFS